MIHANNCTCPHCNRLYEKRATSDYWRTPQGIARRIEMLSQNFTYQVINNSLMFYGQSAGINYVRWVTHPELTKTGPCPICADLEGNVYRKGQFLPPLPAHSGCVCEWELIRVPEEVQPELAPKVTGTGFLVDAPQWSANLETIAKTAALILLFTVVNRSERAKRYTELQRLLILQGYNRVEVEARSDEELEFWLRRGFKQRRTGRLYKKI